jgi:hypothetical protein
MRLICPACGAIASVETWQNDAIIRTFLDAAMKLPGPVQIRALPYLGLFRQGAKALPWRRALTLARSLRDLTEQETIHWQGGETRPVTPDVWGRAMEATIASGPKGLKNHNYMRKCAYDLAEELAAKAEKDREAALRKRAKPVEEEPAPLSEATKKQIDAFKAKAGIR